MSLGAFNIFFCFRAFAASKMALAMAMSAVCLFAAPMAAESAENARPVVLVFQAKQGDGDPKDLGAETARAMRTYFRESKRVDSMVFDSESASVQRAVLEKRLTKDQVASYSTNEQRVEVAEILSFDYAAGAEVSVVRGSEILKQAETTLAKKKPVKNSKDKDIKKEDAEEAARLLADYDAQNQNPLSNSDFVQIKVWMVQVGRKGGKWEAEAHSVVTGTRPIDIENSVQSAASAAILKITEQAFSKLPKTAPITSATATDTQAIDFGDFSTSAQMTASDYTTKADASMQAGNVALAIQQYGQAVSADPASVKLRIKLADAYAKKGLFDQAQEELNRAEAIGKDKALVDEAKARVDQLKNGTASTDAQPKDPVEVTAKADPQQPKDEPSTAASDSRTSVVVSKSPGDAQTQAIAKLVQGDKLWNQGKPDDAAVAYAEAVKLNPSDWRGLERLAIVNASMSLFSESRKAIEQLNAIQPNPPAKTVANRYDMFRKAFDKAFNEVLKQYSADMTDFQAKIITRESCYTVISGISLRMESLVKFIEAVTVPKGKEAANMRRSLACGLVSQAAAGSLDYLETNNKKAQANAEVFLSQARKELAKATQMESSNTAE